MQELWNGKFSRDGLLYGENPNKFIKENVDKFEKNSKILCLGEGEGRNAIFLAKKGLHVEALDASDVGLMKLQKRAQEENIAITIRHTLIENWQPALKYDAIVSSFMHLPKELQEEMLSKSVNALKKDGWFIAEFFSEEQLNFNSGGPKDKELLYNLNDLYTIVKELPCIIHKLSLEIIHLNEGKGHNGEASVIRLALQKN
ncbi:SAM-dependent methyltransferase [Sulfurospirillum sp. 1307]|jgi:cyclopropane fatty-acyl-phospholipid synthase-like methyltransferase